MAEATLTYKNEPKRKLEIRKALTKIYGDQCFYCGYIGDLMTIDHFIPSALGGSDDLKNLRIACYNCNQLKGSYLCSEWAKRIAVEVAKRQERLDQTKSIYYRVSELALHEGVK